MSSRLVTIASILCLVAGLSSLAESSDAVAPQELLANGHTLQEKLVLPGFGQSLVWAASHTILPDGKSAWHENGDHLEAKADDYIAALRMVDPTWEALAKALPKLGEADTATVKKIIWSGVATWRVDLALSPATQSNPDLRRQRHLITPVGDRVLMLSFNGKPEAFEQSREAMRQLALTIAFEIQGLVARYYNSVDFQDLQWVRTDPNVNFDWDEGSPGGAVGNDEFSVRWEGSLRPRHTEEYTFITMTDDGIRVWVDGQLIIENWTDHPIAEDSGTIELKAGTEVPIRVEWYENLGFATAQILWESSSQAREAVPQECLTARPEPGFALAPEPSSEVAPDYGGLPELRDLEWPGGHVLRKPGKLRWRQKAAGHTLTFGADLPVEVTVERHMIDATAAVSLLPELTEDDEIKMEAVVWQEVPTWSVDCALSRERHPDAPHTQLRFYLVPLKRGVLAVTFASNSANWIPPNRDDFLTVFDSIELTAADPIPQPEPEPVKPEDAPF